MSQKAQLTGQELQDAASAYVAKRLSTKGGAIEAVAGLWHKTLPMMIGAGRRISALRLAAIFLELFLLVSAAVFPILARKVAEQAPANTIKPTGFGAIIDAIQRAGDTDIALAGLAVMLIMGPRILSTAAKIRSAQRLNHSAYSDLAAAIEKMPALRFDSNGLGPIADGVDQAIRLSLSALKVEVCQLIAEENNVTDVTLLEFCDPDGNQMQVRARTSNESTHRPISSKHFLAYYVAMRGRWFAEHNFLKSAHPFPTNRLTVRGSPKVNYASVLYLPIMTSERKAMQNPAGEPIQVTIDYCIGVICIHNEKPYRFWRWGDHRKHMGGMGDVAYQRALPYISLITRLIEGGAHRVRAEAP